MSGQASHKGTSDKINVNASGQINTEPQEALLEDESPRAGREEEGKHIPAATERPEGSLQETSSQEVYQYEQPEEGARGTRREPGATGRGRSDRSSDDVTEAPEES